MIKWNGNKKKRSDGRDKFIKTRKRNYEKKNISIKPSVVNCIENWNRDFLGTKIILARNGKNVGTN